ncbi:MAG: transposase [Bacteroidota bacterium]
MQGKLDGRRLQRAPAGVYWAMPYDPSRHHRRSVRLRGYDYAQPGAYFATVYLHDRQVSLLGDVRDGVMRLSEAGAIVESAWDHLPSHYSHVRLDVFVVMPNHIHGIIGLVDPTDGSCATDVVGAGLKPAPTGASQNGPRRPKRHGLPEIVRGFKTFSARRINRARGMSGVPVWQRNYWERVIRNERELDLVRRYIRDNPARWHRDRMHPNRTDPGRRLPQA